MTTPDIAIADPTLQRLHAYWQRKKGGRLAPRRADIAPEEIPDLLPSVFLVEIVGERLRYRLVGTAVTAGYGSDFTGKFMDEIDLDHIAAFSIGEYRRAAEAAVPLVSGFKYKKHDGRYLDYKRLILPLSSDGQTVDMFLCGAVGFGFG